MVYLCGDGRFATLALAMLGARISARRGGVSALTVFAGSGSCRDLARACDTRPHGATGTAPPVLASWPDAMALGQHRVRRGQHGWSRHGVDTFLAALVTSAEEMAEAREELAGGNPTG